MDSEHKKIQSRVSETILSKKKVVFLGKRKYKVASPSIGTLIMVSEKISQLPDLSIPKKDVAEGVLRVAKDGKPICEVCACLIMGAKRIRRPFGELAMRALTRKIELNSNVGEIHIAIKSILLDLDLGDFFVISTFLTGINLTKPTKVETEATVSGR